MSDERVVDLEIKVAFLEDSLGQLDGVVRELHDTVDVLRREVTRLREALANKEEAAHIEKPPHY